MSKNKFNIFKNDFWQQKPFWCQPWSIIISGVLFVSISHLIIQNIILSIILSFIVIMWWALFLYIAPLAYLNQAAHYELNKDSK